jgi:hypothetical protein
MAIERRQNMPETLRNFLWWNFSISTGYFNSLIEIYNLLEKRCHTMTTVNGLKVPEMIYDFIDICNAGGVDITVEEVAEQIAA